ncbi:hypothetical protein ISU82_16405 [Leptospira borgpetersenii serovar Balcanica]|nr:hypothetical protein [Leptospira borgpetersenii]MBF3351620.1 hypothetical protein [Leptospira borgpetersenii serovar Balcanica]
MSSRIFVKLKRLASMVARRVTRPNLNNIDTLSELKAMNLQINNFINF